MVNIATGIDEPDNHRNSQPKGLVGSYIHADGKIGVLFCAKGPSPG